MTTTRMPPDTRILHIISSVDPIHGGPIEGIKQSFEVMSRMGSTREIVSLDSPGDPWVSECPVQVHAVGMGGAWYDIVRRYVPFSRYGYTPHLATWLDKNLASYDLVIVNGLWNFSGIGSRRALRRSGKPYFVFTHGMLDPWFSRTFPLKTLFKQLHWWLGEGPLLKHASGVLFTTEDERVLAHNAFWPYKCREYVVGYGTGDVSGNSEEQQAVFRRAMPDLGNRKYLLFLSRLHMKKGCDLLIDAFARVAARYPDLDLVMAGPDRSGWSSELKTRAARLGLRHRIHWPGMLAGDAKWGAFHGCELFVLPSHQENFGIVVAEALACGKPVVISNKVNIWREVEQHGAGIICNDDGESLEATLLAFLAQTDEEKSAMAAKARTCFTDEFWTNNTMPRLLGVLRGAIDNAPTREVVPT